MHHAAEEIFNFTKPLENIPEMRVRSSMGSLLCVERISGNITLSHFQPASYEFFLRRNKCGLQHVGRDSYLYWELLKER